MNNIKEIWRGEQPLAFTFWVVNVLGGAIMNLIASYIETAGYAESENGLIIIALLLFFLFLLAYVVFSQVSVWRSASNYIDDAKNSQIIGSTSPFWGYVAKITVISVCIQVIIFLFM